MPSFGISETTANPSAIRKGLKTHDMFSEDEVAHRVHVKLANLLVLPAIRSRPEAHQAIEEVVKILDKKYQTFTDYRVCRTRQIIRYVELEDRHRARLAGDS